MPYHFWRLLLVSVSNSASANLVLTTHVTSLRTLHMPQITAITIDDGATTPVPHVFSPETTNGRLAQWNNEAAATLSGRERLTVEVVRPSSSTGAYRHSTTLLLPVLATVDGAQKVVRFIKADVTIHASQESTEQEKLDACVLLSNLFANATVKDSVKKMQPYF